MKSGPSSLFVLQVIVAINLAGFGAGMCSFTNTCTAPPYLCNIPVKLDPLQEPTLKNWTVPAQCPAYADVPNCCTDDQNTILQSKWNLIDYTLGSKGGGCDVCAANMKRLWCEITCSPDQASFVDAGDQAQVPNPIFPSMKSTVMLADVTVSQELAEQLYRSCEKCPYVQEVPAMQSPYGFLNFTGFQSIEEGKTFITFKYPSPLNVTLESCAYNKTTLYGYDIEPCNHTTCEAIPDPTGYQLVDQILLGEVSATLLAAVLFASSAIMLTLAIKKRREANAKFQLMESMESQDSIEVSST
jgi:hypothetical protein